MEKEVTIRVIEKIAKKIEKLEMHIPDWYDEERKKAYKMGCADREHDIVRMLYDMTMELRDAE